MLLNAIAHSLVPLKKPTVGHFKKADLNILVPKQRTVTVTDSIHGSKNAVSDFVFCRKYMDDTLELWGH